MEPSSRASISTLDRIGIVLRRSTTDCTWPRLFSRTARSIVAFIAPKPHHPRTLRHGYSEPFRARKWSVERRCDAEAKALLASPLSDCGSVSGGLLGRHQDRVDLVNDA